MSKPVRSPGSYRCGRCRGSYEVEHVDSGRPGSILDAHRVALESVSQFVLEVPAGSQFVDEAEFVTEHDREASSEPG